MIKFEGKLSDECVLYRTKYSERIVIIVGLILAVIGLTLGLILYIILGHRDTETKEMIFWAGLLVLIVLIFVIDIVKYKKPRVDIYIELTIGNGVIEYTSGPFAPEKVQVSKVKKVLCIGERYYIVAHGDVSTSMMAEKSLLKEGTIEEFEALFADKLVRKKLKGDKGHEKV